MKKVSVFGLGYVGAVTMACLSRDGISVIGVDLNQEKVDMISRGTPPIIELGLAELLDTGVEAKRICATTDGTKAVIDTDITLISVGTPSDETGKLNLNAVFKVCEQIGDAIATKKKPHTVVVRSTVLPGTTEKCAEILREHAGDTPVYVAFNPEFLREGSAIRDYDTPPYTVIGTHDSEAERDLREMYATVEAPFIVTSPGAAEMVKLTANAWHATKISFANEIGRIAKSVGVDGRDVMDLITQDTKLNISKAYMRPGFAYGGSCLPKDVRALTYHGRFTNIDLPLLFSLMPSNSAQINLAIKRVLDIGKRKIGLLGLAFKPGTDDLRESPAVELAEQLMGKGCDLRILDNAVREAKLIGANRDYIDKHIPHLETLMVETPAELIEHADVIVVTHGAAEFREIINSINGNTMILDLAGIFQVAPEGKLYDGIAW